MIGRQELKRAALILLAVVSIANSGCSQKQPGVDVRVNLDAAGQLDQAITVRGLELPEQVASELQTAKWTVRETDGGVKLSRRFSSIQDFGKNGGIAVGALSSALTEQLGVAVPDKPTQQIQVRTTDLLLAKRITMTYTLPALGVKADKCLKCRGTGKITCATCDGATTIRCPECEGTGTLSDAFGDPMTCTRCNGKTIVECPECEGSGTTQCERCRGTGRAIDADKQAFDETVGRAAVRVSLGMPGVGMRADRGSGGADWEYRGSDALGGTQVSASSWIVNWLYVSFAALLVLLLLGLSGVFLMSTRKAKGRITAAQPAYEPQPRVGAQEPNTATPPVGSYCPSCGTPNAPDAAFCATCGTRIEV